MLLEFVVVIFMLLLVVLFININTTLIFVVSILILATVGWFDNKIFVVWLVFIIALVATNSYSASLSLSSVVLLLLCLVYNVNKIFLLLLLVIILVSSILWKIDYDKQNNQNIGKARFNEVISNIQFDNITVKSSFNPQYDFYIFDLDHRLILKHNLSKFTNFDSKNISDESLTDNFYIKKHLNYFIVVNL